MRDGQSLGKRDRDEVVVAAAVKGPVPTQVEIIREGLVIKTDGVQAKYMVRRVS